MSPFVNAVSFRQSGICVVTELEDFLFGDENSNQDISDGDCSVLLLGFIYMGAKKVMLDRKLTYTC